MFFVLERPKGVKTVMKTENFQIIIIIMVLQTNIDYSHKKGSKMAVSHRNEVGRNLVKCKCS